MTGGLKGGRKDRDLREDFTARLESTKLQMCMESSD